MFKIVLSVESAWGFATNLIGTPGFGIYSLAIEYCTWCLLLQMWL